MKKENAKESEENEAEDSTEVHLENTGEIVLPSIDVSKYIGRRVKIEKVSEHSGNFGYYVKIASKVLDTIEGGKEPIELRASRIFGLQEDGEGNIGWGKDTKLGIFLKKMKVSHYNDLVGKEVVVQTNTNKDGREFLAFN